MYKHSVYGELDICCRECYHPAGEYYYSDSENENEKYEQVYNIHINEKKLRNELFDEYFEKYIQDIKYKIFMSERINYSRRRNIPIRKYSVTFKPSIDNNQYKIYKIYAECSDNYCVCDNGNKLYYQGSKGDYYDTKNKEIYYPQKCHCGNYNGVKWHINLTDFNIFYAKKNDITKKIDTNGGVIKYNDLKEKLSKMKPLDSIIFILCYRPFFYAANDK